MFEKASVVNKIFMLFLRHQANIYSCGYGLFYGEL